MAIGVLFALAWLGDVVPAIVLGTLPDSVIEAGTPTNPVYVIDLSIVLPLHIIAGVALWQRRPLGFALAPIVLSFGALMALSLAAMMMVMRHRGIEASLAVAAGMAFVSAASCAVLVLLLRRVR